MLYGTLFCGADQRVKTGYYDDQPRVGSAFVLHGNPDEGVTMVPNVTRVIKVQPVQSASTAALLPTEAKAGDWVFYTPFSEYILREYCREPFFAA